MSRRTSCVPGSHAWTTTVLSAKPASLSIRKKILQPVLPGEKIHEIMVSEEECYRTIERNGYYVIRPMLPELDGLRGETAALAGEYSSAQVTLDHAGLRQLLTPYLTQASMPTEAIAA